jgi:4-hydroxy-tetrahydrodipicolinate reductase
MPSLLRVVVVGATGRMGSAIARLADEDSSLQVIGGIARSSYEAGNTGAAGFHVIESPERAEALLCEADVVIDFSSPELLQRLVRAQRGCLARRPLVVGTTGLGAAELALLDELSTDAPVLSAPNFSVGVNLLVALAEQTARVLGTAYDVEIVEAHHRRKADAPSGTALQLGRAVATGLGADLAQVRRDGRTGVSGERPRGEVGFHALRGGDIVGEHRVMFIGERERLELGHVAADRALFADGALRAARWMHGRAPGRYTMRDVIGLGSR